MNEKYYTARALRDAFYEMKMPEYLRDSYLWLLNSIIKRAKPADNLKENTKGEWVGLMLSVKCSNCGAEYEGLAYTPVRHTEIGNFCPYCGADMRERKETE